MSHISVFCPMNTVTIYVASERIDDLGQFTKFILWAISDRYSVEEISNTVALGNTVVEEEIAYIQRIGFVNNSGSKYLISETGQKYLDLISSIENFNNMQAKAYLNCVTGNISSFNSKIKTQIPENATILPQLINKFIVQNRDYQPLQKFAIANFSKFFSHLRPEFINSLYFYLKHEKTEKKIYQEYVLTEIPPLTKHFNSSDKMIVNISREIKTIYFSYEDIRLERYRMVISILEKLKVFDQSLLSDTALKLIEYAKKEKLVNSKSSPLYVDAATGTCLLEVPVQEELGQRKMPEIKLPSKSITPEEYVEYMFSTESVKYKQKQEKIESKRIVQKIPFSLFKEVDTENES